MSKFKTNNFDVIFIFYCKNFDTQEQSLFILCQAITNTVLVLGLALLANPSTSGRKRRSSASYVDYDADYGDPWHRGREGRDIPIQQRTGSSLNIVSVLDGIFSISGALRFLILQFITVRPAFTTNMM